LIAERQIHAPLREINKKNETCTGNVEGTMTKGSVSLSAGVRPVNT